MSFARALAGSFLARVLSIAIALVGTVIMARALGPELRGVVNYLALVASLPLLLMGFGLEQAWVFLRGKQPERKEAIRGTALVTGGAVALAATAATAAWIWLDPRESLQLYPLAGLIIIAIPSACALGNVARALLHAEQKFFGANLAHVLSQAALVIVLVAFVVRGELGVPEAAFAMLALHGSGMILLLASLRGERFGRFESDLLRQAFRYGLWVFLANVLGLLFYRIDQLMVAWLHPEGDRELGLYGLAVSLVERLWLLSAVMSQVSFPHAAARTAGSPDHTPRLSRMNFAAMLGVAMPLCLLAPLIVPFVFSSEFQESSFMVQLLLPGIILGGMSRVLAADLGARGLVRSNTLAVAVALVVNVLANALWIPRYGGAGAAMASNLAYLTNFLVILGAYRRVSGTSCRELLFLTAADVLVLQSRLRAWMGRYTERDDDTRHPAGAPEER